MAIRARQAYYRQVLWDERSTNAGGISWPLRLLYFRQIGLSFARARESITAGNPLPERKERLALPFLDSTSCCDKHNCYFC